MDDQLKRVRLAYDATVAQYHSGVDPLDGLPPDFKNSRELAALLDDAAHCNSGAPDVRAFLDPQPEMRFLDVGSAASLVNYHLYRWESCYFGVDLSYQLVASMNRFVRSDDIAVGGLAVAEVAALPFGDDSFDIAAVIGVLEYCAARYVSEALTELHRVLRPGSRTVLDIPNEDSPLVDTMFRLEKSLGRPAIRHSRMDFERCLEPRFVVERCDEEHVMLRYFCRVIE